MIEIRYTQTFKKHLKQLAKKYPSLRDDLEALFEDLRKDPKLGAPLGSNAYKIRLAVKSKGGGKSGGLRIITLYQIAVVDDGTVFLLTLYDKADVSTISDKELKTLIKSILAES